MAVLANSSTKRGSWEFPAPARNPHGSGSSMSRPRWRVILVTTVPVPLSGVRMNGGGGGALTGLADVLVDLMRNPVEQQNF